MRFFLLDRVLELVPGERARGVKAVTLTDEVLHDHFPDHPILPGALMIEAGAQLGGFLLEMSGVPPKHRAILVQIDKAKLQGPAVPGDRVVLDATLASRLETAAQIAIEARVEERQIARATLTFMLQKVESERVHEQRRRLYRVWTRDLDPDLVLP
ncbi:MAG: beta-hydroxyacyl-ACP dehydratase [Myxococcales bacterium]|nr:beta-hydroxyacyl-ACP dehydratase [Myxococcales bacterium]